MAFPGPMRAFHEVIQTGSIRKASERLNISPSSVSRQIVILEHEIGTALFDRASSGVIPTHAGRLVADYARTVILDYDALRADLNDLRGSRRLLIRIAVVEGMVCEGAIGAIRRFREKFADVTFRIQVLQPSQIASALKSGECEVGISYLQVPDAALKVIARFPDPVQLAVAARHAFAARSSVTLSEVATLPMALVDNDPVMALIDHALVDEQLTLNPVLVANSVEAVRSFVRGGTGVALLSRRTVERDVMLGLTASIPVEAAVLADASIDILTRQERRLPRVVRLFADEVVGTLDTLT